MWRKGDRFRSVVRLPNRRLQRCAGEKPGSQRAQGHAAPLQVAVARARVGLSARQRVAVPTFCDEHTESGARGRTSRTLAALRIEQADPEVESLGPDHPISGRSPTWPGRSVRSRLPRPRRRRQPSPSGQRRPHAASRPRPMRIRVASAARASWAPLRRRLVAESRHAPALNVRQSSHREPSGLEAESSGEPRGTTCFARLDSPRAVAAAGRPGGRRRPQSSQRRPSCPTVVPATAGFARTADSP